MTAPSFIRALTGGVQCPMDFRTFDDVREFEVQEVTGLGSDVEILGKWVPRREKALVAKLRGPITEHQDRLERLNSKGAGVFFLVNASDGRGVTAPHVIAPRACWADIDSEDWPELPEDVPPASITVRSGRGWHLYWLLQPGEDVAEAEACNRQIAHALGGDLAACDRARVLRLPGFQHMKDPNRPLPVEMEECHPSRRYTVAQLREAFPEAPEPEVPDARELSEAEQQRLSRVAVKDRKRRFSAWLEKREPAIEGHGGNPHTFETCRRAWDFGLEKEDAIECLEPWNAKCDPPWLPGELRDVLERAYTRPENPFGVALLGDREGEEELIEEEPGVWRFGPFIFTRGSLIEHKEPDWLWAGRIPMGKLTLLNGNGGEGKSTILSDLAARVTTGAPMPGEDKGRDPAPVILLAGEESFGLDFKPRLELAGGDSDLLITLRDDSWAWTSGNDKAVEGMHRLLDQTGARLLIVDALKDHTEGSDTREDEVRRALRPFVEFGKKHGVAIVALRHWRKGAGAANERGSGSVAYRNVARAEMVAGTFAEGQQALCMEKSWGPKAPAWLYQIEFAEYEGHITPRVVWKREDPEITADTLSFHEKTLGVREKTKATKKTSEVKPPTQRAVLDVLKVRGPMSMDGLATALVTDTETLQPVLAGMTGSGKLASAKRDFCSYFMLPSDFPAFDA